MIDEEAGPVFKRNILVIDDDVSFRRRIAVDLEDLGEVRCCGTADQGREQVETGWPQIVLLDLDLGEGQPNGLELLAEFKAVDQTVPVIILSADEHYRTAMAAMRLGAFDYLAKSERLEFVKKRIGEALAWSMAQIRARYWTEAIGGTGSGTRMVLGDAPASRRLAEHIQAAAKSYRPVLIQGETGTGKGLVARAIHEAGSRGRQDMIVKSLCDESPTLIESCLRGHAKGTFTDANKDRIGVFELADGSSLFLDEIGELTKGLQGKLLKIVEEGRVCRVGEDDVIRSCDVRLITATNRDLKEMIRRGDFKEDLYHRLAARVVEVPALRDRRADIPELVAFFMHRFHERTGDPLAIIDPEALDLLCSSDLPGNIRTLEHVVETALEDTKNGRISPDDLRNPLAARSNVGRPGETIRLDLDYKSAKRELERRFKVRYIRHHLDLNDWHQARTARKINMSERWLSVTVNELGLLRARRAEA